MVSFGAIERTYHQVDYAKMKNFSVGFVECKLLLLFLNLSHHFLCLDVLRCHDVGYAEIRKDHSTDIEQLQQILS